jgi:murein DD-endopeptidase MepM/ murein hydrolase activator NlpD
LSFSRLSGRPSTARRAVVESRPSWLHRGLAVLAVSALGIGVAGSISLSGAAQSTSNQSTQPADAQPSVVTETVPGVKVPNAFDARTTTVSRGNARPPVAGASVASRVSARAAESAANATTSSDSAAVADPQTIEDRSDALAATAASIEKQDDKLVAKRKKARAAAKAAASKGCVPVVGGYTIAARFGDVGSWARYHTGFDFSAPIGTGLRAPTAGTVMNAGSGPASGWAGNYVVIKQKDGTQVLMAHMSRVSVKVGQTVSACDSVGAVGQTGRAFGPHLHFEVYPAGIEPGDVYKAVDPLPWLTKMHIKP